MNTIQPGLTGEVRQVVTSEKTASAMGSGALEVFATPALIALMEAAAVAAISHHFERGQSSVGTEIQVQHLAPTPIGQTVRAVAEVIAVEGRQITFRVQAWDEHELIGEGTHRRVVIEVERFMGRVEKKNKYEFKSHTAEELLSIYMYELPTPVAGVNGYTELIKKLHKSGEEKLSDIQSRFLETIYQNAQRLALIDRDVKVLYQLSKMQFRLEGFLLADILTQIKLNFIEFKELSPQRIQIYSEDDNLTFYGNVWGIIKLFSSLIENSLNYDPEQNPIRIVLKHIAAKKMILVTVTDKGIGIPDKDKPYIFDVGYQGDSEITSSYQGSGLGLYIAKSIVQLHRGQIWVESEVGKGTTFYVKLPAVRGAKVEEKGE